MLFVWQPVYSRYQAFEGALILRPWLNEAAVDTAATTPKDTETTRRSIGEAQEQFCTFGREKLSHFVPGPYPSVNFFSPNITM